MSKTDVLEERWTATGEYIHLEDGDELCHLRGPAWSQDRNESRAKLMAAAPDMARLLMRGEWADNSDGEYFARCPWCQNRDANGLPQQGQHGINCEWVRVAEKAGLR